MKDKKLEKIIKQEVARQQLTIDLIASENYASPDILSVLGSPLTNKYSEGYPGKRYYPGNKFYDEIELLAQERGLKTFGLSEKDWAINVQPYSGSPANLAIYFSLMSPGDTLMGMNLASGGHLTHGHKVNLSGRIFSAAQYGVDEKTGLIDYDYLKVLAHKYKPKIIVSGLTAYPRKIDFKKFGEIAKEVGAYHVADISHIAGLIAAKLHNSPFAYSDVVMATTHKTLRGPRGAVLYTKKGVKNEEGKEIYELIDRAIFPGMQGGPHNNVTAAKALMFFEALQPSFMKYQKQIIKNAQTLADSLIRKGFNLVTGGTDNHLLLLDLKNVQLDGLTAEKILEENRIVANRNSIPGDSSPFKPSGVRIGTAAVTTRGMKEKEMKLIADLIYRCLVSSGGGSASGGKKESVKKEVEALCRKFPLSY